MALTIDLVVITAVSEQDVVVSVVTLHVDRVSGGRLVEGRMSIIISKGFKW